MVVVLKLCGSISVFVLLTHRSLVFIGPFIGGVVVVIDSARCPWRNGEVRGQCLLTFRAAGICFLRGWFAHNFELPRSGFVLCSNG
jgi:hypothetical protein